MKANELRCKDLMIGDWVFIKDYPIKASPQKVKPEHFVRSLVEFEPIPLTPEILEKNGFVKGSYVGGFYSHWCPFRIYIAEGVGFSVLFNDEIHFTCTYIHQLQHALRLCGIDKTIEL